MSYFLEQLSNIKERIYYLLNYKTNLRDSDHKLIANYWWFEIGEQRIKNMTAEEFLKEFSQGKITGPETIRRCRQKLQEENRELRGLSYKARKKEGVEVKQNIKS